MIPTILIHSSKTMKPSGHTARSPRLIENAQQLATYVKTLTLDQLKEAMNISPKLALVTQQAFSHWTGQPRCTALDSFVGDIYSGLRAGEFTTADREYADRTLRILSGLYGILRPLDGIEPYRLEIAYKFPQAPYDNLYNFWGTSIAEQLPEKGMIINTSSVEYTKTVTPFVDPTRIITPRFLTLNPTTGEPEFTTVHAKIARGAFARWMILNRIDTSSQLKGFDDLGYVFDVQRSTNSEPVFVCQKFGGIGLSIRLK